MSMVLIISPALWERVRERVTPGVSLTSVLSERERLKY